MWRDLRDGLAFVGRSRLILVTCGLFMILNLAMNGVVMATLYSMQMAGHRPEVIGMVTFALGAGAWSRRRGRVPASPGRRPTIRRS